MSLSTVREWGNALRGESRRGILADVSPLEDIVPADVRQRYETHEWRHASAILAKDFAEQWKDIIAVLRGFTLRKADMLEGGGRKSKIASALDGAFYERGWQEKQFETTVTIDRQAHESPTHKVDCVKGRIALEVEWSNKDPFYDRDLNNFRLLFDLGAISVGVIITKSDELRTTMKELGIWSKYGSSTTWMQKLVPRIEGGGGGGCPILVFGITKQAYDSGV